MPEILRIFGLRFFFYSREHEPIHVHVKKWYEYFGSVSGANNNETDEDMV